MPRLKVQKLKSTKAHDLVSLKAQSKMLKAQKSKTQSPKVQTVFTIYFIKFVLNKALLLKEINFNSNSKYSDDVKQ